MVFKFVFLRRDAVRVVVANVRFIILRVKVAGREVEWTSDAWCGSVAAQGLTRKTGNVPSAGRRYLSLTVRGSGGALAASFALSLSLSLGFRSFCLC